jgi:hypothetical protein
MAVFFFIYQDFLIYLMRKSEYVKFRAERRRPPWGIGAANEGQVGRIRVVYAM